MKTKQIGILASILALVIGSAMPVIAAPGGNSPSSSRVKKQVQRNNGGQRGDRDGQREKMQERFEEIFEKVDADGSGEVSVEELKEAHQARVEKMKEERDGDRKGNGDRPELTEEQREAMKAKRKKHVREVFKRADQDGSGELNEEEFRRFVHHMRTHKKRHGHGSHGKGGQRGGGGSEPIQD